MSTTAHPLLQAEVRCTFADYSIKEVVAVLHKTLNEFCISAAFKGDLNSDNYIYFESKEMFYHDLCEEIVEKLVKVTPITMKYSIVEKHSVLE